MNLAKRIKPISYLKANAAEILKDLNAGAEPLIITQNGEAKAVLIDIGEYEREHQTLAMLRLIAMGDREIEAGETEPLDDVLDRLLAS